MFVHPGSNTYSYCSENPVVHSDPNGLSPIDPQDYLTFNEFSAAWPDKVTSVETIQSIWNSQTRQGWTARALKAAGIDYNKWVPSKGFTYNIQNINKVYEYYKALYLANHKLKWAAMAKMAGGEVFRGLEGDLQPMIDFAHALDDHDPSTIGVGDLYELYAGSTIRVLLEMQQDIFLDLAWQHQAYVEGGMRAIDVAHRREELSDANYEAWVKIDSNTEEDIWAGNRELLYREQALILQGGQEYVGSGAIGSIKVQSFTDHYARIQRIPDNNMIPETMSEQALSPIPKGARFSKIVPGGDITNLTDRWKWIDTDMLPKFRNLPTADMERYISLPVRDLAKRPF